MHHIVLSVSVRYAAEVPSIIITQIEGKKQWMKRWIKQEMKRRFDDGCKIK